MVIITSYFSVQHAVYAAKRATMLTNFVATPNGDVVSDVVKVAAFRTYLNGMAVRRAMTSVCRRSLSSPEGASKNFLVFVSFIGLNVGYK